jgi:hypothetical protein
MRTVLVRLHTRTETWRWWQRGLFIVLVPWLALLAWGATWQAGSNRMLAYFASAVVLLLWLGAISESTSTPTSSVQRAAPSTAATPVRRPTQHEPADRADVAADDPASDDHDCSAAAMFPTGTSGCWLPTRTALTAATTTARLRIQEPPPAPPSARSSTDPGTTPTTGATSPTTTPRRTNQWGVVVFPITDIHNA